jgi:hypothetical protein
VKRRQLSLREVLPMSGTFFRVLVLGLAACGLLMSGCGASSESTGDLSPVGATSSGNQGRDDASREVGASDGSVPPIARDWPIVDASSCVDLPTIASRAALVRVPSLDVNCIAASPLDGIRVYAADTIDMSLGAPTSGAPSGGHVYTVVQSMSSTEVRVVTWDNESPSYLIVRGSEVDGPSVDEIVTGLR